MKFAATLVLASGLLAAAAPTVPVNARNAEADLAERDPALSGKAAAALAAGFGTIISVGGLAALNKWGAPKNPARRDVPQQPEDDEPLLLFSLDPASLGLQKREEGSQPLLLLSVDPASLGLDKRDPKISENAFKVIAGSLGAAATVIGGGIVNGQIKIPGINN